MQIDQMMVFFSVYGVIALIIAAGDKALPAGQRKRIQRRLAVLIPRVLHAQAPLGAVCPQADGANVASHADGGAGKAALLSGPGALFHGKALADAAHIQTHGRVPEFHRACRFIDHKILDIAMPGGLLQGLLTGQGGILCILQPGCARIVPQRKHSPCGHIGFAVGLRIHRLGLLQKGDNALIHLHGALACHFVYIGQIHNALVGVVNIIQPVIFQKVLVKSLHLAVPFLFTLCVADHIGDGVKGIPAQPAVLCRHLPGSLFGVLIIHSHQHGQRGGSQKRQQRIQAL